MPMSDTDIVERLRWQKRYPRGIVPVTMEDAAKEIERLRTQVETLQNRDERWRMRMRDLREMEMDGERAKLKRFVFDLIMAGPDATP